jgi:hypothetical protein
MKQVSFADSGHALEMADIEMRSRVDERMLEEILWWTRELLADAATLDTEKRLAEHLQALAVELIRLQGARQRTAD